MAAKSGTRFVVGTDICSISAAFALSLGPNLAPFPVGTSGSFPEVKQSICEADHLSISSTGVKNAWSYDVTPYYVCIEWCLK